MNIPFIQIITFNDTLVGLDAQGNIWQRNPVTLLWESINTETN